MPKTNQYAAIRERIREICFRIGLTRVFRKTFYLCTSDDTVRLQSNINEEKRLLLELQKICKQLMKQACFLL